MLQRLRFRAVAAVGAWRRSRRRADAPRSMESVAAWQGGSEVRAPGPRFGHSTLPRTNRHAPILATLLAAAALLPTSHGVGAEAPSEWAFAQRMTLGERSSTLCYDRGNLRAEGTAIRVKVRHRIADRGVANGCGTASGEAAGVTVDSEILIRCGDRRWRDVGSANARGKAPPSSGSPWREAAAGDYSTLMEEICAPGAPSQNRGPAVRGAGTAAAGATRVPAISPGAIDGSSRYESARAAAPAAGGNPQASARRASSGTGFFVDGNCNALTNHHVVEFCRQIMLVAADKQWRARVVARDATLDLALVKVDRTSAS